MKAIIFIGTYKSGSSREALKAAEKLGYYTVLFTERLNFIKNRSSFPEVHLMKLCDLNNLEEIKQNIRPLILKGIKICAIVSFIDPYCYTACLLAEEFGVNRFSTQAINTMQDKILSRQVLSTSPYNPSFTILKDGDALLSSAEQKLTVGYPFILKLPHSTSSKDVYKINNSKQFKRYMKKISQKSGESILAEEFLDGPQYLVEVLVHQKKVHIAAIIQQEITHDMRFIVTGYNLLIDPPADFYDDLKKAVEAIIFTHGMESGACHLEMRHVWKDKTLPIAKEADDWGNLQNKEWKIVEVNPRISGSGMNRLIEIGLGFNLVEETLKMALGQEPNLSPRHKQNVFAQYVILSETGILEKITGRKKACDCPGVREVFLKPRKGTLLIPPLSMGHRYAYVIATGNSEESAIHNAKFAASQIKFWLTPPSENLSDNKIVVDAGASVTSLLQ
jgi:biotin carboxylase